MSKQDRQGVRRASDIEQKYNLGGIKNENEKQSAALSQLMQSLSECYSDIREITNNIKTISDNVKNLSDEVDNLTLDIYPVGSLYIGLNDTNPSELFGGTWDLFTEGHMLLGLNSSELPQMLQSLDICYVWRRTA